MGLALVYLLTVLLVIPPLEKAYHHWLYAFRNRTYLIRPYKSRGPPQYRGLTLHTVNALRFILQTRLSTSGHVTFYAYCQSRRKE